MEPPASQFDLRWRMFGIGVRVHPTFWLFTMILGWPLVQQNAWYVLVWVLCAFVSILFHELGHIIAGRVFGSPGHIVLYSFGGLAIGSYQYARPWQRILISLAGPAAGFTLYGLVLALDHLVIREHFHVLRLNVYVINAIFFLLFMNFFWSLLNLIPVFPLDGGQVLRDVCIIASPRRGEKAALGLSFLIGAFIAAYAVMVLICNTPETPIEQHLYWPPVHPLFPAIMFGLLAMQSLQMYRQIDRQRGGWPDD